VIIIDINMFKLSQQAIVVTIAAMLPVVVAVYKHRMLDSFVLSIVGAITIYNVDCLTKGNCNTWATLVSMSFLVTSFLQFATPHEFYTTREKRDYGWDTGVFPSDTELNDASLNKLIKIKENLTKRLSAIDIDVGNARNKADIYLQSQSNNSNNYGELSSIYFSDTNINTLSPYDDADDTEDVQEDDKKFVKVRVCKKI